MGRWLYLLLLEALIITLTISSGSVINATEERCIQLKFSDANSLSFRGLLLQKHEQTDVWVYAHLSGDEGDTLAANRLSFELSYRGTIPVVTVITNTATYQLPVEWRSDVYKWMFSVLTYKRNDLSFTVQVQLSPQQAIHQCANVSAMSFSVLIASRAPGVQWLLDHGTAYEGDFSTEDYFSLTQLQCYPEIALAVQGHRLFFSENGFATEPSYSYDICALAQLSSMDCSTLVVEDILLTRSNLLVLTQTELFVSSATVGSTTALQSIRNLPFETQGARFQMNSLICNHVHMADYDQIIIAGHPRGQPTVFDVWKSPPPYTSWETWSTTLWSMTSDPYESMRVLYDTQRRTYTALLATTPATEYVIEEGGGFKLFQLPCGFTPTGLVHHSTTSTVYIVGNEVWMSVDGGLTFSQIHSFSSGEFVVDFDYSEQRIAFLTSTGRLYHSRPRSYQIIELELDVALQNGSSLLGSSLLFDSTGELNAVGLHGENGTIASVTIPLILNEKENVRVCQFSAEIVNSNLLLVYSNDSSNSTCSLSKGDIGLTTNASFGYGVILGVEKSQVLVGVVDHPEAPDLETEEWMVYDEHCWFKLQATHGFGQTHEMDVGDHILLRVELQLVTSVPIPRNLIPDALWEVSIIFGNPQLFEFFITHHHHPSNHYMTVDVLQKNTSINPVQTAVTFQLVHCSTHCRKCSLTTIISSTCPTGKRLTFVYPTVQTTSQLYQLPTNYRPPSWLGTNIPLSPNVYNSDPSQPLMNSNYDISKRAARFNQCAGNISRAQCNCSLTMAASTDIGFSDCIQRVYQHASGNSFPLRFQLELGASGHVEPVHRIIHLLELNNRTDFAVEGQSDATIINTISSKKLIFNGPGLYHFRATITDHLSFCNLQAQFTVFVVRTPLTTAGEYCTTVLTTVLIGLSILVSFALYNHFPRLHRH